MTGNGATEYGDINGDSGSTMGNKVDDYGEGVTGNDSNDDNNYNGDGIERRNNHGAHPHF